MRAATILLLSLLAVTGAPADTPGNDRPPVLLKSMPMETPVEAGGTGLAPEVAIRVTLDDRGRVADVEVLSIKPSSEYDEHFVTALRETLEGYRYAPAIRDGKPSGTVLEWTVQFVSRGESGEEEGGRSLFHLTTRTPELEEEEHVQILRMPAKLRLAMLEQEAAIAEKQMNKESRRRADTPRFISVSDAPDPQAVQGLANNLEATFNILADLVTETVDLQPEPYRLLAFMYADKKSYKGLTSKVSNFDWSAGFYHPSGMIAFHMQMPSNESLVGLMLHEATHAFLDRYVVRPGVPLPIWAGEGLAEYMGNSRVKGGKLIPGKTRKGEAYIGPWGIYRWRSQAMLSVGDIKKAIRLRKALSLERVITADRRTFYSEDRGTYYAMGWLLVHFLRHGKPGWEYDKFTVMLLYMAEGYPSREVLESVYETDLESMEKEFREYVLRF